MGILKKESKPKAKSKPKELGDTVKVKSSRGVFTVSKDFYLANKQRLELV